ncbi:MAG: hypothetical protein JO142_14690 [Burkholderiales bacterium]|nr:hypothetical protein [Burkholderiales bacterium]
MMNKPDVIESDEIVSNLKQSVEIAKMVQLTVEEIQEVSGAMLPPNHPTGIYT